MVDEERRQPLQPGERAPDFTLPAADREGVVSLAEYRDRGPVLLALFRGLYWGFCRRHVAQLGGTREKLHTVGVETLAIMATNPARARFYFRFRPPRVRVGADPDLVAHRLYGVPNSAVVPVTPDLLEAYRTTYINPMGDLPRPMPVLEASAETNRIDGHELTESDREEMQRHFPIAVGQFLVDRAGIVRWVNIEGAKEGMAGAGKFPSDEELLSAARALID